MIRQSFGSELPPIPNVTDSEAAEALILAFLHPPKISAVGLALSSGAKTFP
jgi:hypothetical protein